MPKSDAITDRLNTELAESKPKKKNIPTNTQKEVIKDDKSLSIIANAGSGKTSLLVDKLLYILIEKNISLDNIAAITFTRKAAGEMKQKLADSLQSRFQTESDSDTRSKLYALRSKIASANIRTIHSFCKEIISSFPVEAGVDLNFSILEEQNTTQLVTEIVENTLSNTNIETQPESNELQEAEDLRDLVRFFGGKKELIDTVLVILYKRRLFTRFLEEYEVDGGDRKKRLESFYEEIQELLFDKDFDNLIEKINNLNTFVLENNKKSTIATEVKPKIDGFGATKEFSEKLSYYKSICELILKKDHTILIRGYLEKLDFPEKETIESMIVAHPSWRLINNKLNTPPDAPEQILALDQFQSKVAELGKLILQKYTERKQAEGMLDNEDLILKTRELLRNKDIIASLQEKFRILMVDEYQDTDDIQYDIFKPIMNDLKDKMHTLFIVGDKKQSIYTFRGAELEVFEKTRADIEREEGTQHLLKESFRMAPAIAAFTNHLFEKLFHDPRESFNEVGFEETICAYPHPDEGTASLIYANPTPIPKKRTSADKKKANISEVIAEKIVQLSRDPAFSYSDVMVLSRRHAHFTPLMTEFAKNGIPYVYSAGKNYFNSSVVKDIATFLSFLVDPLNREVMIALLRSPFFMIRDEDIITLATLSKSQYDLWFLVQKSEIESIKKAAQILLGLLQNSRVMSIASLIRKVVTDTGMLLHAAHRFDGQQQVANIEKLIEMALIQEAEGKTGLYDFNRFLNDSIADSTSEADAEVKSEQGKVSLLTIHSAKGLQSKIVFVILDDYPLKLSTDTLFFDKKYGPLGKIQLNTEQGKIRFEPWLLTYHQFVQKKKEEAELKRLLYVAVTRAENKLFLVLTAPLTEFANPGRMDHLLYQMPELQNAVLSDSIQFTQRLKRATLSPDAHWEEIAEDYNAMVTIETLESMRADKTSKGNSKDSPPIAETSLSGIEAARPNLSTLSTGTSGEIVSASAYALYKQCPLKYYLTLIADFGSITESVDEAFETELDESDEESGSSKTTLHISPAIRGSLLHYLLEKKVPSKGAMNESVAYLTSKGITTTDNDQSSVISDIISTYQRYTESEFWSELQTSEKASSEFQFYMGIRDFICLGVIDLMIEYESEVLIIDFKSNKVSEGKLAAEAEKYIHQMNLYALAASRLFPDKQINVILSFIRHPELPIKRLLSKKELIAIEHDLTQVISGMRSGIFPSNTEHCSRCNFASEGQSCIRNR